MTPEQTALDPANLEFSLDQIQQMTHAVLTHVLDHHAELADRPIRGDFDGIEDLCRNLKEALPETGVPLESLLDPMFRDWIP